MYSHGTLAPVDDDPALLRDERWALTLRIASSPHFIKATQPRDILLYITRRLLTEGAKSISELDIARAVLKRRSNFDPNDDSIVRVQISHIRKKLEAYFATEGRAETILLTIPKGSYVPQFGLVSKPDPTPSSTDAGANTPQPPRVVDSSIRSTPARVWLLAVVMFALGALLVLAISGITRKAGLKAVPGASSNQYAQNPLLKKIFGSSAPVSIVIADSSLSMVEDTLRVDVPVHDYTNKDHVNGLIQKIADRNLQQALQMVYNRQYTSLGEANVAFKCKEVSMQFGNDASIRYARYMHARDFEKGNFVLIGSRRGVPWAELFESQLNFAYGKDLQTQEAYFENKQPQAGEQHKYIQIDGKESYVDIALVPNLGKNGYVLLIRGLEMEANEAAADFLFSTDISKYLPQQAKANDPRQSMEILLRNHVAEGVSSGFDVVAARQF
jgi:hypothetical protein